MPFRKITIIRTRKPMSDNINEELQWLGGTLGLFNQRDKDKSCFRIFITLLRNVKSERGMSSDQIADQLKLTRGTVVHHLNKLMSSGIVVTERNKYILSVENLDSLVSEVEEHIQKTLRDVREIAKTVDDKLNI